MRTFKDIGVTTPGLYIETCDGTSTRYTIITEIAEDDIYMLDDNSDEIRSYEIHSLKGYKYTKVTIPAEQFLNVNPDNYPELFI